jgi:hypothetical protein
MKVKTIGRAVAASFGAVVAVAVAATPAVADPVPATDYRQLTVVGSDTTQDLVNALGATVGGGTVFSSWDARPPAGATTTIKTKATGCEFLRPNGSSAGRRALRASEGEDIGGGVGVWPDATGVNIQGCVDFSRSSSYGGGSNPQSTGNYVYIPTGVDALTLAVHEDGDLPFNWSFAQIQRVYKCFDTQVAGNPVVPRLVQAGSGTWEFWTQPARMAITENEISLGDYPCLAPNGVPLHPRVQEHDGTALTGNPTHVVPFGAGPFVSQTNKAVIEANIPNQTIQDRRGPAHLVGVSTTSTPTTQPIVSGVLNVNFPVPLRRDVYNVVPARRLSEPLFQSTFVGPNSAVCSVTVNVNGQPRRVTELLGFGFRPTFNSPLDANCGYTDLRFNS